MAERVLHLYRSNRAEALADAAADLFATPASGASPLDPEHIVVQGRGMAVWLSMQLSQRHGVWAGGKFLYPRNFLRELFERVLGSGISPRYERRELMWAVLSLLGEAHPELAPLSAYTARDERGHRRFQLARRIADTFDEYLTYRPDWVRAWDRGEDTFIPEGQRWQPALWRLLTEELGRDHAAGLEHAVLTALGDDEPIASLPPRIAVFGIAGLPPMYVRILAALSRHVEVHWFLPSPATGYWADLATPERVARAGDEAEALHLDAGHPLLASLGRLGAEQQIVLSAELEALGVAEHEPRGDMHRMPTGSTVLAGLQHDILEARLDRRGPIAEGDRSIELHACHSPMREVEVLFDLLLDQLEAGVAPHEIVVMMPDVESYAPLIEAVFDREPGDLRFIPYRIADRHVRRDSPVVDAFLRTLELVGGRAPVSAVTDLLALAPIQRRFDIAPEEIDVVRRWIAESGIRWGIDEAHRAAHGQPQERANTWRFGLDRMLLGYAMPSDGRETFADTLAYDEIEGQDAELLGKVASFCETLFGYMRRLDALRTVGEHADEMVAVLEAMSEADSDSAAEHRLLRRALTEIAASAEASGFHEPVGIEVMRSLLEDAVEQAEPARGFLAGGVTFCAMVPMRNIPFRVVCLLGLSDQAFPRARRPVDFDLIAVRGEGPLARRPGDRSRRDDDRYLFLEALHAARERVLLIYTGQSVRDGSELAPSVVVSELLDTIAASHPESNVAELMKRHPLQPFNARYFEPDSGLFSYSEEYCAAALRLGAGDMRAPPALFAEPLPRPEAVEDAVALGELVRFFEGPVRYLMTRRLGIDLRDEDLDAADREPVDLDPLERWAVGDLLLGLRVDGVPIEETERLARATGVLPIGTPGSIDHHAILREVEPIAERVQLLREGGRLPDLAISGRLPGGTLLSGEVANRWVRGHLRHQFSRVSGKQLVSLWIRHLALCWRNPNNESFVVGRAPTGHRRATIAYRFAPVSEPAPLLDTLVALYARGASEPLVLSPKAGFKFAQARRAGKSEPQALQSARSTYHTERERDPHLRRAFGGEDVIQGAFAELADAVFGPLVERLEEVR